MQTNPPLPSPSPFPSAISSAFSPLLPVFFFVCPTLCLSSVVLALSLARLPPRASLRVGRWTRVGGRSTVPRTRQCSRLQVACCCYIVLLLLITAATAAATAAAERSCSLQVYASTSPMRLVYIHFLLCMQPISFLISRLYPTSQSATYIHMYIRFLHPWA